MSTTALNPKRSEGTPAPLPDKPAGTTTLVLMGFAAVYIVWGSTYLAIRIGIESFPPLILAGLRHTFVGILLYPILRGKTGIRPTRANWVAAVITGTLLLFVGNGGVSWAEQTVPSGIAALLVVASLAWACGSLHSKHGGMPSSAMLGVAMQSLTGGVILLIAGLFAGEFGGLHLGAISMRSWLALGYLIVFGSGIGFSAYIYILQKSTAARVATYAVVNPVVALFLGWLILGETITLRTVIAAAVILTAVILVITAPHRAPAPAVSAVPARGEA